MELITAKLRDIHPYERNPRNNDAAVDAVAESIEQCSYIAPIIVDEDGVILAGHTRYKALKKLGYTECEIIVKGGLTDDQKRKYRILDNKTNELAEWDIDFLNMELEGLDFDGFDFGFDAEEPADDYEEQDRAFKERMAMGEISAEDEEYQEFLQKFELKKTTDDCYTPDNVYKAVRDFCVERYSLNGKKIIRPFYPGGDYQKEDYSGDCVVIDNPPFSIISEICEFYTEREIPFFMFAPTLTLLGIMRGEAKYVACGAGVIYENGANVNTSFVTNLGAQKIVASSELREILEEANKENLKRMRKELPKYSYPNEVLTSTMLCYLAAHGETLEIEEKDVYFIRAIDSQKATGKGLFGSGFLLSESAALKKTKAEKAAAEKAAAEKAAAEKADAYIWELSDREKEIVKSLG